VLPGVRDLVGVLYNEVPSGVGSRGRIKLTREDQRRVIERGARWAVEQGMGSARDLDKTESGGCMDGVDHTLVSEKAFERGRAQQGTLGSGNHFLEIQYVDEIFDQKTADAFGLFKDQVVIMIHTGSRGFGHQVCTDYLATIARASQKYGITLPDRELACAPFKSTEGAEYFSAMKAAANYAWANRQCIMHWTMEAVAKFFKATPQSAGLSLVYDVAHNIAKVEEHEVQGRRRKLVVHRKGATRAFPAGHPELPAEYRHTGQPVIIPGDMGRSSYVLAGAEGAMRQTFGSTCHGAGRVMSRHQAIKMAKGRSIRREMEDLGIAVMSAGRETLAEEMSEAYKDVANVVDVVVGAGLSRKVARMRPIGVVKG